MKAVIDDSTMQLCGVRGPDYRDGRRKTLGGTRAWNTRIDTLIDECRYFINPEVCL